MQSLPKFIKLNLIWLPLGGQPRQDSASQHQLTPTVIVD